MLILSLLLLQAAEPADALPGVYVSGMEDDAANPPVIVSRRSLRSTAATLEQCLARHCPPAEDIANSMEHAENQFVAGQIEGARKTLLAARSRNKRYADTLPREVSNLVQFDADIAALLGLADYGRIATFASIDALKAGLPKDDPAISAKRLEVADVFLRQGKYLTAVRMYDAVAKRAQESGWPQLQGAAMFRSLRFYAMAASVDRAYGYESKKRFAALRDTTDPAIKPMRDAALILAVKLKLLSAEDAEVNAAMQELGNVKVASPVLVYAPAVDLRRLASSSGIVTPSVLEDQWVDFSYRIAPSGDVHDVEIVAQSSSVKDWLVTAMHESLERRRYVPLEMSPGSAGVWQRERLMAVADIVAMAGSRIRVKAGRPKLMTIDLTSKMQPTL